MSPITLFTFSGPIIGVAGWLWGLSWLFWIGAALALVNLGMNVASGAMKLPVIPAIAILVGSILGDPRIVGAALGLMAYTFIEACGGALHEMGLIRR